MKQINMILFRVMSFKGPVEIAIIALIITARVYIEIQDNFRIPLMENWLPDDELIFPDDNASCHRKAI